MNRIGMAAFAAIVGLLPTVGKAISVSQSIDRTEMRFEDTATYEIVVSWDGPPTKYRFEKAMRLETDKLKVASFASTVNSRGTGPDEVSSKVVQYRLAPTGSGVGRIEPLAIEYAEWPDTTIGVLMTDAITVSIAQPVPVSVETDNGAPGWIWILIIVVVAGGAVGVFFWKRGRPSTPPPRTPAEAFLDDLAVLRKESGSDLKQFQTGLYKILVVFISVLFRIDVNGRTTESILADLDKVDVSRDTKDTLADWLRRAEREKYAPVEAAPGETIRLESEIRSFVEKHF